MPTKKLHTQLRISEELNSRITEIAAIENRSFNGQVEHFLAGAVKTYDLMYELLQQAYENDESKIKDILTEIKTAGTYETVLSILKSNMVKE